MWLLILTAVGVVSSMVLTSYLTRPKPTGLLKEMAEKRGHLIPQGQLEAYELDRRGTGGDDAYYWDLAPRAMRTVIAKMAGVMPPADVSTMTWADVRTVYETTQEMVEDLVHILEGDEGLGIEEAKQWVSIEYHSFPNVLDRMLGDAIRNADPVTVDQKSLARTVAAYLRGKYL